MPQFFTPLLHPLHFTVIPNFYTILDLPQRYLKINYRFLHSLLHPMGPKNVLEPHMNTHTDRHTDANDTIHTFLSQFCNPHTPKIVQVWLGYLQYWGKIWVPSCNGSSAFSWSWPSCILLSPFMEGPFSIKSSFRPYSKVNSNCTSILIQKFN